MYLYVVNFTTYYSHLESAGSCEVGIPGELFYMLLSLGNIWNRMAYWSSSEVLFRFSFSLILAR